MTVFAKSVIDLMQKPSIVRHPYFRGMKREE